MATKPVFQVDSVDIAYRELKFKGVEFTRRPTPIADGKKIADFLDSEGNVLHLRKMMS